MSSVLQGKESFFASVVQVWIPGRGVPGPAQVLRQLSANHCGPGNTALGRARPRRHPHPRLGRQRGLTEGSPQGQRTIWRWTQEVEVRMLCWYHCTIRIIKAQLFRMTHVREPLRLRFPRKQTERENWVQLDFGRGLLGQKHRRSEGSCVGRRGIGMSWKGTDNFDLAHKELWAQTAVPSHPEPRQGPALGTCRIDRSLDVPWPWGRVLALEEGSPFSQVQCWGRDSTESHRHATIPASRETEPHTGGEVSAEGQTEAGASAVRQGISPKCEAMSFRFCLPWTSHPRGLNAPISGKEDSAADGLGPSSRLDPGQRKDTVVYWAPAMRWSVLVPCAAHGPPFRRREWGVPNIL